jgi:serine phosphatase RsbU (regulator of sigma subunit)
MERACILFVDDEPHNLTSFKAAFRRHYDIHLANSASEAMQILAKEPIQLIITDQRMPDITGVQLLEQIIPQYPAAIRIILTGFSDVEAIIDAINQGQVYRYMTKPWDKDSLKVTIDNALEAYNLRKENDTLIAHLQEAKEGLEKKVIERTQEIQKVNTSLEHALGMVEKQRDDMLGSINYAQRIQQAILPLPQSLDQLFADNFILYMPRDIVSGDFYWFEEIDQKQFIIAADCTGHGVPGAFMTMLGVQALTNIIIQNKIHQPDQILTRLDQVLRRILKSSSTMVHDGMDIVVLMVDKAQQALHYAGAKNPLLMVQNGEMTEIKGSIHSINGHHSSSDQVSFENHIIPLTTPTTFYMYSDGYQDQFGGPRNKKFMKTRFKAILTEMATQPMPQQKQVLEQTIREWMDAEKADNEEHFGQIDDILVMGIRV